MHIEVAVLLAWLDGQLPARRAARVARHLASCARCRLESGRLQAELDWVVQTDTPAASELEQSLESLMERIRGWAGEPDRTRKLAAEVAAYFGARAANLLDRIEPGRPEEGGPMVAAELLFSAFLGRAAAARVLRAASREFV
jgi:anti-sigma factor RsiW